jgi:hypothetical protein
MELEGANPEKRFSNTANAKVLAFLKAEATPLTPQSLAILESRGHAIHHQMRLKGPLIPTILKHIPSWLEDFTS